MTEKEWLKIGYDSKAISKIEGDVKTFKDVYADWFRYKAGQIKPQSLDRIECTYNKYYLSSTFASMRLDDISETAVIDFINSIFASCGEMTLKEYRKLYQIVNNVLNYALDFNYLGSQLLNWKKVKEYCYSNHVVSSGKDVVAVKDVDIEKLHDFVLSQGYGQKQSACLLLILNFYLGLRVGELAALEWSDVDFDKKLLHVSRSETKKFERLPDGTRGKLLYEIAEPKTKNGVRKIPLCDKALVLLRLLKQHHVHMGYESIRLLYDGSDIIGTRSLEGTLRKICKLADVPFFNTHMIRKTVATKMHYKGMPTRIIADILGHAEIATTERCYILTDTEYFDSVGHTLNDVLTY